MVAKLNVQSFYMSTQPERLPKETAAAQSRHLEGCRRYGNGSSSCDTDQNAEGEHVCCRGLGGGCTNLGSGQVTGSRFLGSFRSRLMCTDTDGTVRTWTFITEHDRAAAVNQQLYVTDSLTGIQQLRRRKKHMDPSASKQNLQN